MMQYHLSQHAQDVIENRNIKGVWIDQVLNTPSLIEKVAENEVCYFAQIESFENRCLKVVYNPQKKLVITVYFDRGMRKKGCK